MNIRSQDVGSGGLSSPDLVRIGDLTLDLRQQELRDGAGAHVDLRNRSFGVLRHLVKNAGRVVSKDELLAANWPGLSVTEDSLTQCISDIRRLLGESGRDIVRTIARRGYMIVLPEPPIRTKPTSSTGPTVAVWPFETDSGALQRFADGLTRQIVLALGRFGELRVLATSVVQSYKDRFEGTADFGRALGVDYFVEGELRLDGDLTRVDVHLTDARTGTQLWTKTFRVEVTPENLPTVQDRISGQASAMIGSYWGAIGAAEYKHIQNKPSAELTPYECIVQGVIGIPTDATVLEPVAKARECLERLTREEPRNAAAWAALVLVFNNQRTWGFPSPTGEIGSIEDRLYLADLAVDAANRAVEIAPNDAFVRGLVARAAWMACQPDLLRIETMRAIELNPNDPQNLGPLGNLMAYAGFWDEGVALAEKGIALTAPSTPRWWWWASAKRAFAYGNYAEAFTAFRQSYVEQLWISHLHMAYTLPFLDRTSEAQAHVATLLRMRPGFTVREADAYYKMWCFAPSYRGKMCDALRHAGLPGDRLAP
ncbi:winged helix-turn-helix domain-containing protein [Bradyrhizobium sp. U87765 SZCCT0131]|uniref:winged helix-turn-helix domain-containing tetratricopeptide repeat protein n=1 Tax=unclassified Bradyrhizobium TaxID=2631580 RepID=UPI001BA65255|nr:winged helix-turn-helix domain-containing protein [Bradyrhizobium sp. U87765 SZCCT0131]MBR1259699.1 winged helix-turn-helix domain-containing protein [Bradyrhizobium sp. U87765 SZCCT0134]MBR1305840.1 winged helix-turn-helix domain-containing protein [Bradyrhizobium sp. U87765 SZCCT0110]MBR1322207.1 winged helix-turn-helix domain-containing protein [Bradyrhizobium sp. U87765 SZCCT0109]MBR1350514.1 winged helix-turn-helix domain-containing protein [Bradyrhizobium sp. U87765 SZCCT0048]